MQTTSHAKFPAQLRGKAASKRRRIRRLAAVDGPGKAPSTGGAVPIAALLFADVADAGGGRIAVFYRDGLAALELHESPAADGITCTPQDSGQG